MYYRLHDTEPNGMIETPECETEIWNALGYGIFRSVQEFDGPRRIDNLVRIRAWAVDIDEGTKTDQQSYIKRSPLKPSEVVETKNGYHLYFNAADATPENYRKVVTRLADFFHGDKNARDLARVLRVPGYWHMKDPASPFLVRSLFSRPEYIYTEAQMLASYPVSEEEKKDSIRRHKARVASPNQNSSEDFWVRIYDLDCRDALDRLSGHDIVNGETFTFEDTFGGKCNIIVDGHTTSCWIDSEGHIGSLSGGGPTIFNWIVWYNVEPGEATKVIRELFPEVVSG